MCRRVVYYDACFVGLMLEESTGESIGSQATGLILKQYMKGCAVAVHTIEQVIRIVANALRDVAGIDAVVLGGSRATGHYSANSDIDIGVYYGATMEIDIKSINRIAEQLDDYHRANLVTSPGGWGPWVNAGGWLEIDGYHVDLILRDTQRVAQVIQDCLSGVVHAHYQPGHPHAYINVMYMGELAESQLLWDETNMVTSLKQCAEHYPDAVQTALYEMFGFEASFSVDLAIKNINRDDPYYVIAHVVRAISAMNQVIFAANRRYCLNEKKAVMRADGFAICPPDYRLRIENILANVTGRPSIAHEDLRRLVDETNALISR